MTEHANIYIEIKKTYIFNNLLNTPLTYKYIWTIIKCTCHKKNLTIVLNQSHHHFKVISLHFNKCFNLKKVVFYIVINFFCAIKRVFYVTLKNTKKRCIAYISLFTQYCLKDEWKWLCLWPLPSTEYLICRLRVLSASNSQNTLLLFGIKKSRRSIFFWPPINKVCIFCIKERFLFKSYNIKFNKVVRRFVNYKRKSLK